MKTNQAEQDVINSGINALLTLGKSLCCLAYNFNLRPDTVYLLVSRNYVLWKC
jgi:hypothetical protein